MIIDIYNNYYMQMQYLQSQITPSAAALFCGKTHTQILLTFKETAEICFNPCNDHLHHTAPP